LIVREPERGKAERDQGAEKVGDQPDSSIWQDLLYLLKTKTYIWSTIGYTSVVFVTGTLSWWASNAIIYANAAEKNVTDIKKFSNNDKSNITLIFGVMMTLGGLIGVTIGTVFAQMWKRGQACFRGRHNPRADALVCMIGSIVACPFLFLGMHLIDIQMVCSWIAMFVAVTFLCLNWAINVDMLLYIILPKRRSIATGVQILISHLFGDASGPYIIGIISDRIRGADETTHARYKSLVYAFYIPTFLLVVSAICFGVSAWTLVGDKEKFDVAMGYKSASQKVTMISGKGLDNSAFDENKNA